MTERRYLSTQFTDEQLDRWRAMQPEPGPQLSWAELGVLGTLGNACQRRRAKTGLEYPLEWQKRMARALSENPNVHVNDHARIEAIAYAIKRYEAEQAWLKERGR